MFCFVDENLHFNFNLSDFKFFETQMSMKFHNSTPKTPFTPAKLIHRKAYRYQKVPSQLPLSNLFSWYGNKLFKANDANQKLSGRFLKNKQISKVHFIVLINKVDEVPNWLQINSFYAKTVPRNVHSPNPLKTYLLIKSRYQGILFSKLYF